MVRRLIAAPALLLLPASLSLLSACGLGTGGLFAALEKDSSDNSPSVVQSFGVESAKTDPATLSFTVRDPENDAASVSLVWVSQSMISGQMVESPPQPLSLVDERRDLGGARLDSLPPGEYSLRWNFAQDVGAGFRQDVVIKALVGSSVDLEFPLDGQSGRPMGIGNDAPRFAVATEMVDGQPLEFVDPVLPDLSDGQVSGKVLVQVQVEDSSADAVDIQAEFALVESASLSELRNLDGPFFGTGGPLDFMALDDLSISGFLRGQAEREPAGPNFILYWNTTQETREGRQVAGRERFVVLRLTPFDLDEQGQRIPLADGEDRGYLTRPVRIDNNSEPVVEVGVEFALNPDSRRGIPIPMSVLDQEGDDVRVAIQYFRSAAELANPDFDLSGKTPDRILEILADPELREQFRIASEQPLAFTGNALPAPGMDPARNLRAEGLAGPSAALLFSGGVAGDQRQVQILRSTRVPVEWQPTRPNPLNAPAAVLPMGLGQRALVLDGSGGGWRLRRIDLATGAVESTLVQSGAGGTPTAMSLEPGGTSLLVAAHNGSHWSLHRVFLDGSGTRALLSSAEATDPKVPTTPIAGLLADRNSSAVLTTGNALVRAAYLDGQPPKIAFGTTLAEPRGIVMDPGKLNRAYVAEAGSDRIVHIDLNTFQFVKLAVTSLEGLQLTRPSALAIETHGTRLLVLSSDGRHLDTVRLGEPLDTDEDGAPDTTLQRVISDLSTPASALATGPDQLRIVVHRDSSSLSLAGGVEQVRPILDYDCSRQILRVGEPPLEPPLDLTSGARRWRILDRIRAIGEVPGQAILDVFVWDSADAEAAGRAFVRVTPFDDEVGQVSTTESEKRVLHRIEVPEQIYDARGDSDLNQPEHVIAVDMNLDGCKELLTTNRGGLNGNSGLSGIGIFRQARPGVFAYDSMVGGLEDVRWMVTALVDDDEIPDFALSARNFGQISLFEPGGAPVTLSEGSDPSNACELAFIDGDDRPDLIVTRKRLAQIQIFLQPLGGFTANQAPDIDLVLSGTSLDLEQAIGCRAVDVDMDGLTDVVGTFASSFSGDIPPALAILRQDPPGVFDLDKVQVIRCSSEGPTTEAELWHFYIDDYDRNGLVDFAVSYRDIGKSKVGVDELRVIYQTEPMVFAQECTLRLTGPALIEPHTLDAADFDQDGLSDLVCGVLGFSGINLFPQETEGKFGSNVLIYNDPDTVGSRGILSEDVNGDGWADVVVSNQASDTLSVYLQNRPGRMEPTPLRLDARFLTNPLRCASSDFNSDGLLDVATINGSLDNITVFFQFTPGAFNSVPTVLVMPLNEDRDFNETDEADDIQGADVDGDGRPDLVVAVGRPDDTSFVYVFHQDSVCDDEGLGTFECVDSVELDPAAVDVRAVRAADLDQDGRMDLVTGNAGSDDLDLYFQDGSGAFVLDATQDLPAGARPIEVVVVDLNSDGCNDIVALNEGFDAEGTSRAPSLSIYYQDPAAPGRFPASNQVQLLIPDAVRLVSLCVADLNEDGRLDIALADSERSLFGQPDRLLVLAQAADGSFDPSTALELRPATSSPASMLRPSMLRCGDVDLDGDMDLVVSCGVIPPDNPDTEIPPSSENVLVFRQVGGGVFDRYPLELSSPGDPGRRPTFVDLADINADGELDIVTAHEARDEIFVHFGGR